MTNREMTTLMHRLFPGDLPGAAEYVHLMVEGQLDRERFNALIDRYIPGNELLIFVNRNHCAVADRAGAFEHVRGFMAYGRVRIADPRFKGRVIVEPLGGGGWLCTLAPRSIRTS